MNLPEWHVLNSSGKTICRCYSEADANQIASTLKGFSVEQVRSGKCGYCGYDGPSVQQEDGYYYCGSCGGI